MSNGTTAARRVRCSLRQTSTRVHLCNRFESCLSSDGAARFRRHASDTASYHERTTGKVIFSGIQPTGVPHLGNYLGALRQWVKMQGEAAPSTALLFSVVDLHALTSRQEADHRRKSKRDMLAALLAVGLDPERSILFYQSSVPAHAELHWILSCDASMGILSRMTQWKSKLSEDGLAALPSPTPNPKQQERMKLGLFSYPVLQAADILVHRATHVPVGEDQQQHIEFARTCAAQFNHAHAHGASQPIFISPEPLISPAKRIMSLVEPLKKMSKSHENPKSRILLNDSPEEVSKKIKTALTDSVEGVSYDRENRPGVSNLIEILSHLSKDSESCQDIAVDLKDSSLRTLKERTATVVSSHLAPVRDKYEGLVSARNAQVLDDIASRGAQMASDSASRTLRAVRDALGI